VALEHPCRGFAVRAWALLEHPRRGLAERASAALQHPRRGLDERAWAPLEHPRRGLAERASAALQKLRCGFAVRTWVALEKARYGFDGRAWRVAPRFGKRVGVARLAAVTFDFWSTLVDGNMTPERTARRMARLHAAIVGAGHEVSVDELERAFDFSLERVAGAARDSLEDVGPPGRWAELARELGIPEGLIPYEVVEKAYEDITLEPMPNAMPHVREALEAMRSRGYRMGVICNTGMAGGRVLREVLRRHRLLGYFDVTVFSNEFGMSKPHPSIFAHTLAALGGVVAREALHVGDIEDLDVEGARRAGLGSALYAPGAHAGLETRTDADFVVRDWRDFGGEIDQFVMPDRGR
jgi:putative hydrolase of the HAD superfamily